jgi:hypothetical protein
LGGPLRATGGAGVVTAAVLCKMAQQINVTLKRALV